ncbi:hypothetical protein [Streptomyces violascens]|uniref:hypothetical protein n=1 Tax=Streptomyces violascens TaxID=67381 RepID=UPI0036C7E86B
MAESKRDIREPGSHEPNSPSRSAYLRLLALHRAGQPVAPEAAEEAGQPPERLERQAIVDELRPPVRMWPDYPDFWVESPRGGGPWHERFGDKGPRRSGLASRRGGQESAPAPSRLSVGEAYLRLRLALGAEPA